MLPAFAAEARHGEADVAFPDQPRDVLRRESLPGHHIQSAEGSVSVLRVAEVSFDESVSGGAGWGSAGGRRDLYALLGGVEGNLLGADFTAEVAGCVGEAGNGLFRLGLAIAADGDAAGVRIRLTLEMVVVKDFPSGNVAVVKPADFLASLQNRADQSGGGQQLQSGLVAGQQDDDGESADGDGEKQEAAGPATAKGSNFFMVGMPAVLRFGASGGGPGR